VKNTGALAGNEVSQLYLGFPSAYGEPPKMLRGFAQTMLAREQTKTVIIPLRQKDVSVWDVVSQQWVSSSRTIHLEGTFQL
jgi:beta-glucosidase